MSVCLHVCLSAAPHLCTSALQVYYYDAQGGQAIDLAQLATEVHTFVSVMEAANQGSGQGFERFPTQYYDKTADLFSY